MRTTILPALAATLLISAAPPEQVTGLSGYDEPVQPWRSVEDGQAAKACRDRIEQARGAAGQPKLDRSPADPDKPMLLHAVDRKIDGCGVLVLVADPTDLRPFPESGPPAIIPARPR